MTKLLRLNEVSAATGYAVPTLRRKIAEGALAAVRLSPRALRVRQEDLETFLRQQAVGKPPATRSEEAR